MTTNEDHLVMSDLPVAAARPCGQRGCVALADGDHALCRAHQEEIRQVAIRHTEAVAKRHQRRGSRKARAAGTPA